MDGQLGGYAGSFFPRHSLDKDSAVGIVYALDLSLESREVSSHDTDTVAGSYWEASDFVVLRKIIR